MSSSSSGRGVAGAAEGPVGQLLVRRVVEVAGEEHVEREETRCERIVREGRQGDRHHTGTGMSGDNNTIHRKVCMNHLKQERSWTLFIAVDFWLFWGVSPLLN